MSILKKIAGLGANRKSAVRNKNKVVAEKASISKKIYDLEDDIERLQKEIKALRSKRAKLK
jgi:archaellum component FlaC